MLSSIVNIGLDLFVTLCRIWHHLYNLKTVKNTPGGVILLVNLQPPDLFEKSALHECFSCYLDDKNSIKSRKAYQIAQSVSNVSLLK